MKIIFFCLLASILVSIPVKAQSGLQNKLQTIVQQYNLVGMSVSVLKQDSLVYSGAFGKRDIARNLPMTESTVYRIASISKMITAIAAMQLYEQGLFSLHEDISSKLGFTLRNPAYPNTVITPGMVLNHTAGLRDGNGYFNFLSATASNTVPDISRLVQSGGSYYTTDMWDQSRQPGSYFNYANINYGIIGTLIEKVSGKRFDVYCRDHILAPLGIDGSFNIQDLPDINQLAVLYRKSGSSWNPELDNYGGVKPPPRDLAGYTIGKNGLIFGPQGSLRISTKDLGTITKMFMNGGKVGTVRLLQDSTVQRMMMMNWVYTGSGSGNNYSGIFNNYSQGMHLTTALLSGESLYGHPGEAYGLISDCYFSKDKKYAIVFATNGGVWGNGNYSGWYNLEEDVFKACFSELPNFIVSIDDEGISPSQFTLYQSYPNPFNPSTTITFYASFDCTLHCQITDVLGTVVYEEVSEHGIGTGTVRWNGISNSGAEVSSGVYLYRITVNSRNGGNASYHTGKAVLIR